MGTLDELKIQFMSLQLPLHHILHIQLSCCSVRGAFCSLGPDKLFKAALSGSSSLRLLPTRVKDSTRSQDLQYLGVSNNQGPQYGPHVEGLLCKDAQKGPSIHS